MRFIFVGIFVSPTVTVQNGCTEKTTLTIMIYEQHLPQHDQRSNEASLLKTDEDAEVTPPPHPQTKTQPRLQETLIKDHET